MIITCIVIVSIDYCIKSLFSYCMKIRIEVMIIEQFLRNKGSNYLTAKVLEIGGRGST